MTADLHFYFDPVCPFAWMTSKWVRTVATQRRYTVDWRFISLRLINSHVDYDTHFPPEYEAGHTAGLRLLRVASAVREAHGRVAVGRLYETFGTHIFETPRDDVLARATDPDAGRGLAELALRDAGLPPRFADAVTDESLDVDIAAESDEALSLTGKDVGTPILHFQPPEGVAFFGPVISRLPDGPDAVALWDHVVALVNFAGFAELKRSLRELPQLPAFGVSVGGIGRQEDWHAGSRRQKK